MMNVSGIYASYMEHSGIGIQAEETNQFVVRALHHVIRDVFSQLSTTLVITIATSSWTMGQWFEHVLGDLMSGWNAVSVQLLHVNNSGHVPGRKFCNLLLVDSYEGLLSTNMTIDNAGFDDQEYYFIFLQTADKFLDREMRLILDHCLLHYWLNCNVMVQTAQVEVLVYTYYPYTAEHCQAAEPQLMNRFDGHRMLHEPMFPHKLRQLHKCPLTLLLWHMPPYVELTWDDHTSQLRARGFEVKVVELLARRLNFTIELYNITLLHVNNYQLATAKGTTLGPIELLIQQRANLSIGYFRKTARRDGLLTSTPPHYYVPLAAVLKSEHFRFSRVKLLTFPFQNVVWQILLAALLLHWGIYMWRWRESGWQVMELLLGVTVGRLPSSWLQRIIYAHWLYGSIPLRIVYQSLLFHFIRSQLFVPVPSSFEELLDSNFQALCTSNSVEMLREMPPVARHLESFTGIDSAYDQDVLDALHQMTPGKRIFAITSIDVTNAHMRATQRMHQYHLLTQYVNIQQVVIYMPKHSYFYKKFHDILSHLDAGGFITFWRRSIFAEYSRRNSRNQTKSQEQLLLEQRRRIHQTQLNGLYSLMACIYALAALIFTGEMLLHRLFNVYAVIE